MGSQRNVETLVVLHPIAVDTGSPDQEGMLVMANGLLVAVLVKLKALEHKNSGHWFMETGLGRLRGLRPGTFETLQDASRWVRRHFKS